MASTNGSPAKKRPHRKRTPAAPVQAAPTPAPAPQPVTARLADLRDPQYEARTWRHIVPPDVDWQAALARGYWINVLTKVTPGDRIEVFSSGFDVGFELLVQEVVPLGGYVRLLARPLFPADLVLPAAPAGGPAEPRYFMRPGPDRNMWEICDRPRNLVIRQRISRQAADDHCAALNQADAEARALVAAEVRPVDGIAAGTWHGAPQPEPSVPEAAAAAEQLAALGRADQQQGAS